MRLKGKQLQFFKSAVITGTGSSQSTAHGLGRVPDLVLIHLYGGPSSYTAPTVTEGTHTSTNCVVTVTTGWKYVIFAC
jgi:hypothetical protein